ncbi:MarR family transcriptional regulator [Flammeovirgaceae bacterium SG7u.111]|nr:MarR family transcriptional regulator [Flammeovirgaceae bacterium SG7u.132]WPO35102.1 MarR family transcriptional regulator [Flammeovirgaceae bacterium SG7u.111]
MALKHKESKNYGVLIERTIKKIRQHLQKNFNEKELGLTIDQWVLLELLNRKEGVSQKVIAEQSNKDAPTVTRIIDLLCKKKLAERRVNEDDRRRFNVHLTELGREKVKEVYPVVLDMRRTGWQGLDDNDFNELSRILEKICNNFD